MASRSYIKSFSTSILGFFAGLAAGLLMAPKSGKQNRELIIKTTQSLKRKK